VKDHPHVDLILILFLLFKILNFFLGGVVTMMVSWAEMFSNRYNTTELVKNRLNWMLKYAAPYLLPVGEAVDGITGKFVMS
jgi:hypothetical protein